MDINDINDINVIQFPLAFFDLVSHHNLWSPGWCWVRAICHSAKPPQRADQLTAFVSTSGSVLDESHVRKLFLKCKKSQIVDINIKMMFLMSEGSKFRYVGVFFSGRFASNIHQSKRGVHSVHLTTLSHVILQVLRRESFELKDHR